MEFSLNNINTIFISIKCANHFHILSNTNPIIKINKKKYENGKNKRIPDFTDYKSKTQEWS